MAAQPSPAPSPGAAIQSPPGRPLAMAADNSQLEPGHGPPPSTLTSATSTLRPTSAQLPQKAQNSTVEERDNTAEHSDRVRGAPRRPVPSVPAVPSMSSAVHHARNYPSTSTPFDATASSPPSITTNTLSDSYSFPAAPAAATPDTAPSDTSPSDTTQSNPCPRHGPQQRLQLLPTAQDELPLGSAAGAPTTTESAEGRCTCAPVYVDRDATVSGGVSGRGSSTDSPDINTVCVCSVPGLTCRCRNARQAETDMRVTTDKDESAMTPSSIWARSTVSPPAAIATSTTTTLTSTPSLPSTSSALVRRPPSMPLPGSSSSSASGSTASTTSRGKVPAPVSSAPLLLLRRRERAPLLQREDDMPTLPMPGIPTLTGLADYTGPAPGFVFGSCPSGPLSSPGSSGPMAETNGPLSPSFSPGLAPLSSSDFTFDPLRLARRSTPTVELGPFEYPATASDRKGSTASTSSYTSHLSYSSHTSSAPLMSPVNVAPPLPLRTSPSPASVPTLPPLERYGSIGSSTSPRTPALGISSDRQSSGGSVSSGTGTETAGASATSIPTPAAFPPTASPPLGRRGSIALGQIPRLARTVPSRPRGHAPTSSLSFTSSGGSGTYASLVGASPGSASQPLPSDGQRSASAGNPTVSGKSTTPRGTPRGSPALAPVFTTSPITGPVYLLPRTASGGSIAFAHAALPAPVPPSLLARRGSVPNTLLWGLHSLEGSLPASGVGTFPTVNTQGNGSGGGSGAPGNMSGSGGTSPVVSKMFRRPTAPASHARRWSNRDDLPADQAALTTRGSIESLSERAQKNRPASMHLTPTSKSILSSSPSASTTSSRSSLNSTPQRPAFGTSNSDVTTIDALSDEHADEVESLDDESQDGIGVDVGTAGRAAVSASPTKMRFTFPPLPHETRSYGSNLAPLAPLQGEHGEHSGHEHGKGHEAHFPDPCAIGVNHPPSSKHSPFVGGVDRSERGDRLERRRYAAYPPTSICPPLSTVPSSEGTDGGTEE